jgi:hypothetical protein
MQEWQIVLKEFNHIKSKYLEQHVSLTASEYAEVTGIARASVYSEGKR